MCCNTYIPKIFCLQLKHIHISFNYVWLSVYTFLLRTTIIITIYHKIVRHFSCPQLTFIESTKIRPISPHGTLRLWRHNKQTNSSGQVIHKSIQHFAKLCLLCSWYMVAIYGHKYPIRAKSCDKINPIRGVRNTNNVNLLAADVQYSLRPNLSSRRDINLRGQIGSSISAKIQTTSGIRVRELNEQIPHLHSRYFVAGIIMEKLLITT